MLGEKIGYTVNEGRFGADDRELDSFVLREPEEAMEIFRREVRVFRDVVSGRVPRSPKEPVDERAFTE